MGACASRGYDSGLEDSKPSRIIEASKRSGIQNSSPLRANPYSSPKKLSFSYNNRTVSTIISKTTVLNDLNSVLLSTFGVSDSTYVVTGVLVTTTGPLMPFFMLPYLHSNTPDNPYPIVMALLKDFGINNWGCAPDELAQREVTVEWTEVAKLMESCEESDEQLYSSPASAILASRFFDILRRHGYLRLRLPQSSPIPDIFQAATTSAHRFFSKSEEEKRTKFLGFNQSKFVGYSHAKGSARQFLQLRTTREKVTFTDKAVPSFDAKFTEAYLALQEISYQIFKLLCHPQLTAQTHLSPKSYSSLLDAPIASVNAFHHCSSAPQHQFLGTNVFRVYQYLRETESKRGDSPVNDEAQSPGFLGAATSVHSDMGLLTVSPQANLPGLTLLKHSDASRWVNVEMKPGSTCVDGSDSEKNFVFVFIGETLAHLTRGSLLAPLHFVDERTPTCPRFSMPFFLRARQTCVLPAVEGLCEEMTVEHYLTKFLHQRKQVWGRKPTTDF